MRIFRETFLTVAAVFSVIRDFIVKWFLPLHGEEEEDDSAAPSRLKIARRGEDGEYAGLLSFPDEEKEAIEEEAHEEEPATDGDSEDRPMAD